MSKEGKNNAALLKRCNKLYNHIGMIYIAGCGMYIAAATFLLIVTVAGDAMFLFMDGLVFKGLLFFFGYGAAYTHNDRMALTAPCIAAVNMILPELTGGMNYVDMAFGGNGYGMSSIVLAVTALLSFVTLKLNKDYHYLEEQEGFPFFNEIEKELLNAPKEYVSMKEKFHIEARDNMEDIPELPDDSMENAPELSKGGMEDIQEIPKDSTPEDSK